jgi:glycine cleavage system H protein
MPKVGHYYVKTEYYYWNTYIWISRISDTELHIGLTDYGQQNLKDITNINSPSVGQRFEQNGLLMTIESIAREYPVKSPVSCVITQINNDVMLSPESLNDDPFENWILKVEALDLGELDLLIDGENMADEVLEEVGQERMAVMDNDIDDMGDDDFDYENEFTIDSPEDYTDDDEW